MKLKGSIIQMMPLRCVDDDNLLRQHDDSEIEAFLEEDRIDPHIVRRVRDLPSG